MMQNVSHEIDLVNALRCVHIAMRHLSCWVRFG